MACVGGIVALHRFLVLVGWIRGNEEVQKSLPSHAAQTYAPLVSPESADAAVQSANPHIRCYDNAVHWNSAVKTGRDGIKRYFESKNLRLSFQNLDKAVSQGFVMGPFQSCGLTALSNFFPVYVIIWAGHPRVVSNSLFLSANLQSIDRSKRHKVPNTTVKFVACSVTIIIINIIITN